MPSSDIELILACARPSFGPAQADQVRPLLSAQLDWDWILEQASWHCVGPLLYQALRKSADLVPASVLDVLRSAYEANFRRNLFFSGRMVQLARKMDEAGIPVVAYKGPVLCDFYKDLGLREFSDLDFLVRPQDVARANSLLADQGFLPHLHKPCDQESRTLPFARAFHYEMVYTTADGNTKVDLHWALMPGFWAFPDQVDEIWDRLTPAQVGGASVMTLGREDTLLLLCAHGAKHMWRSLGWLCDVAALLNSVPDLDWRAVSERADKLRMKRALYLALLLAHDLLAVPLPPDILATSRDDRAIHRLADNVKQALFDSSAREDAVLPSCSFLMRTREHPRDALRCGLERIFQPTMAEWQSIALPRFLFPAYYFLRPMRLLAKHGFGE